jgi:tRNA(Ile)-lysidine synthase
MLHKLQQHINIKFPFLKDKKILIAISGGLDSVVLTQLLSTLKFNISLAHCNFKLRGKESELDAIFVKELAEKISVKHYTTSFNTEEFAKRNKQSTQIAARNLRYNWFQEIALQNNFDYILTAHHADDNLETFLINFTRGSGLDGFTGIPAINKNIVRPLLIFSREEINTYATENNISWREDKSNLSTKYIRNKIRHKVVPILKEINSSLLETFSKTVENLKESKHIIDDKIEEIAKNIIYEQDGVLKLSISKINNLSNPKAYLFQLLKDYNFTEFNDVYRLLNAQSGKQVFSKTHVLLKDRDFLLLSKVVTSSEVQQFLIEENQLEITNPIHLIFGESSSENRNTIKVSKDKLKFPLIVRKWQNGDYFYPTGMQGKKKLSKYFKDEKLSLLEKEQMWLLCNNDNAIIWLIGKRQDNRFYTSKENGNTIKINLE